MDSWLVEVALFGAGSMLALFQWVLKRWLVNLEQSIEDLHKSQKEIDKELQVIKETYVPKADLKDIKDEIISRLARIETFLMKDK